MKGLIQRYILSSRLNRLKRKVKVANLKLAKSALLVYDASNEEDERLVRQFARFLKEEGIKAESIGFYKKKNKTDEGPQDELGYHYLKKEELNWLMIPTSNRVKKMISNDYNLLIDLNLSDVFCLQFISSLSKASFKVGIADGYQQNCCDLTISVPNKDLATLIEQMKVYLQMINN